MLHQSVMSKDKNGAALYRFTNSKIIAILLLTTLPKETIRSLDVKDVRCALVLINYSRRVRRI